eukprot:939999-Prymnesium_polylepis.2
MNHRGGATGRRDNLPVRIVRGREKLDLARARGSGRRLSGPLELLGLRNALKLAPGSDTSERIQPAFRQSKFESSQHTVAVSAYTAAERICMAPAPTTTWYVLMLAGMLPTEV